MLCRGRFNVNNLQNIFTKPNITAAYHHDHLANTTITEKYFFFIQDLPYQLKLSNFYSKIST